MPQGDSQQPAPGATRPGPAELGHRRIPLPDRKSLTFRLIVGASLLCGATLLAAYVLIYHSVRSASEARRRCRPDRPAGRSRRRAGDHGRRRHRPGARAGPAEIRSATLRSVLAGRVRGHAADPIALAVGRAPARPVAENALGEISLREIKGPRSERLRLAQRTLAVRSADSAGDLFRRRPIWLRCWRRRGSSRASWRIALVCPWRRTGLGRGAAGARRLAAAGGDQVGAGRHPRRHRPAAVGRRADRDRAAGARTERACSTTMAR